MQNNYEPLRQGETFTIEVGVLNEQGQQVSLGIDEKLIAAIYDTNNVRLIYSDTDNDIIYDRLSNSYKWSIGHETSVTFKGKVYLETTIVGENDVVHCKYREVIEFDPRLNNQLI